MADAPNDSIAANQLRKKANKISERGQLSSIEITQVNALKDYINKDARGWDQTRSFYQRAYKLWAKPNGVSELLAKLRAGSESVAKSKRESDLLTELERGSDLLAKLEKGLELLAKLEGAFKLLAELEGGSELLENLQGVCLLAGLQGGSELLDKIKSVFDLLAKVQGGSELFSKIEGLSDLIAELQGGPKLSAKCAVVLVSGTLGGTVIRDLGRKKQDYLIGLTSKIIEEDPKLRKVLHSFLDSFSIPDWIQGTTGLREEGNEGRVGYPKNVRTDVAFPLTITEDANDLAPRNRGTITSGVYFESGNSENGPIPQKRPRTESAVHDGENVSTSGLIRTANLTAWKPPVGGPHSHYRHLAWENLGSTQPTELPSFRNLLQEEPCAVQQQGGSMRPSYLSHPPGQRRSPPVQPSKTAGTMYVSMMIDRSAIDLPYYNIQPFWMLAEDFWSGHTAYEGFIHSDLWQSEREEPLMETRCMSIWLSRSLGDVWVIVRLRHKEGVEILNLLGVEADPGEKSGFAWDRVSGFLAHLLPAVAASQLRQDERGAQFTECVWIRATDEGEDMFLAFCVEFNEGMGIQDRCTRTPGSSNAHITYPQ